MRRRAGPARLIEGAGLLPDGYTLTWRTWPSILGAAIGLTVAMLGVLTASRRAARIPPLAALRDDDSRARAMTGTRWALGLGLAAVTGVLVAIAPAAGLVAATALSLGVAMCGGIAVSLLSPLVVPPASRALGLALRGSTIGVIAAANVRHAVRRTASTAAPLIILVALVVGLAGTLAVTQASEIELRDTTVGDLVVETTGRHADQVAALSGVTFASIEIDAPVMLDIPSSWKAKPSMSASRPASPPSTPAAINAPTPFTPSPGICVTYGGPPSR